METPPPFTPTRALAFRSWATSMSRRARSRGSRVMLTTSWMSARLSTVLGPWSEFFWPAVAVTTTASSSLAAARSTSTSAVWLTCRKTLSMTLGAAPVR